MAKFRIKIAGAAAEVSSLFDSTRDYCARYLTQDAPEFTVAVSRENLIFEQGELLAEAIAEGMRPRTFSDPFLDRAAIQRAVAEHLFFRDTLMVHGSLIAVDGVGYLFAADRCGTGKSTHTRLWREYFGNRAVMVNDDKPFLRLGADGVLAFGAPWSGKHGLDTNISVPLGGICLLERGLENRIRPAAPEELESLLKKQSLCPAGQELRQEELVRRLVRSVPLWRLACTKDLSAVQTAYKAMGCGIQERSCPEPTGKNCPGNLALENGL